MSMISDPIYKHDANGRIRIWTYEVDGARWRTISGLQDGEKVVIGVRVLLNQSGISASITRHHPDRETIIEGRRVSERPFFRVTAYEANRSFRFTELHGWGLVRSVNPDGW